jgi:hypothetical protein
MEHHLGESDAPEDEEDSASSSSFDMDPFPLQLHEQSSNHEHIPMAATTTVAAAADDDDDDDLSEYPRIIPNDLWIADQLALFKTQQEYYVAYDDNACNYRKCLPVITCRHIILMTLMAGFQQSFFNEMDKMITATSAMEILVDDFGDDEELVTQPETLPSLAELAVSATKLGNLLGSLSSLQNFRVYFREGTTAVYASTLAAVANGCTQVVKLHVDLENLYDDHYESLQAFLSSIQDHASLKEINVPHIPTPEALRVLLECLPSFTKLKTLTMSNSLFDVDELEHDAAALSTAEDAERLMRLLNTATIHNITLCGLYVEDAALNALHRRISESGGVKSADLDFFPWDGPGTYTMSLSLKELVNQETKESMSVSVSSRDLFWSSVSSIDQSDLLQHVFDWKLHSLILNIQPHQWTITLQKALAKCLARDDHVRSFKIFSSDFGGYEIEDFASQSSALLEAVCFGNGSLDNIEFECNSESYAFDASWIQQMKRMVTYNYNRLKRIHGARFEAIQLVDSGAPRRSALVKALHQADHVARYKFLSDNFADCRTLLITEMECEKPNKKRRRSEC